MSDRSRIEWTDRTWNPVRGCTRVSEGCRFCYAERQAARGLPGHHSPTTGEPFAKMTKAGPRWTGAVEFLPHKLAEPLGWRKPARVFVNSMSDLFHEDLTDAEIAAIFGVMATCQHLTFQVLSKRPKRAVEWFRWLEEDGSNKGIEARIIIAIYAVFASDSVKERNRRTAENPGQKSEDSNTWPLPNVWLGISAEDQATADQRIPLLLQCPAAVRFVSYEPALGPVDFGAYVWPSCILTREEHDQHCEGGFFCEERSLDWIIVGGESGPGARPFEIEWARSTVRHCRKAGVPVFVKQLGSHPVSVDRLDHEEAPLGVVALRDRKGGDPAEWPEDLRVREFPSAHGGR